MGKGLGLKLGKSIEEVGIINIKSRNFPSSKSLNMSQKKNNNGYIVYLNKLNRCCDHKTINLKTE